MQIILIESVILVIHNVQVVGRALRIAMDVIQLKVGLGIIILVIILVLSEHSFQLTSQIVLLALNIVFLVLDLRVIVQPAH